MHISLHQDRFHLEVANASMGLVHSLSKDQFLDVDSITCIQRYAKFVFPQIPIPFLRIFFHLFRSWCTLWSFQLEDCCNPFLTKKKTHQYRGATTKPNRKKKRRVRVKRRGGTKSLRPTEQRRRKKKGKHAFSFVLCSEKKQNAPHFHLYILHTYSIPKDNEKDNAAETRKHCRMLNNPERST